jgi:hypothetical protein
MFRVKSRILAITAFLLAMGGLFAAYKGTHDSFCSAFSSVCPVATVEEPVPSIPPYVTDWVDGNPEGGSVYCKPRLEAMQAQYPNFTISLRMPEGEHRVVTAFPKHDQYRYSCIFSAQRKRDTGSG